MKLEEPCEGRPSSTVPWERKGETPLRDPIVLPNAIIILSLQYFVVLEDKFL